MVVVVVVLMKYHNLEVEDLSLVHLWEQAARDRQTERRSNRQPGTERDREIV